MFGGLFGHGFGPHGGPANFEAMYRAMPVAFIDKQSAEFGDKVILPPSALDRLGGSRAPGPLEALEIAGAHWGLAEAERRDPCPACARLTRPAQRRCTSSTRCCSRWRASPMAAPRTAVCSSS